MVVAVRRHRDLFGRDKAVIIWSEPFHGFASRRRAQHPQQLRHMIAHREMRKAELAGDCLVRKPLHEQRSNVLLPPGQRRHVPGSRPSCRRGSAIDPYGSRKNLQLCAFGQQRGNPAYKLKIIRLDEESDRLARRKPRFRTPRRASAVGHAAAGRGCYAIAHDGGRRHCRYWLHIAHAVRTKWLPGHAGYYFLWTARGVGLSAPAFCQWLLATDERHAASRGDKGPIS